MTPASQQSVSRKQIHPFPKTPSGNPPQEQDCLDSWGLRLAFIVTIVAQLPFFLTVPTGLQFGDGTELVTAAHILGVPHPTGYPAYMLLLHLWMKVVAIGEPILRSNLFNMLCIGLVGGMTAAIFLRILRATCTDWHPKAQLLASCSVGLLVPVLRFPWAAAIVTEVYALQLLLAVAVVVGVVRFVERPTQRRWLLLALLGSLGLAHHRLGLFPALTVILAGIWAIRKLGPRELLSGWLVLLLLPFILYLYLPLRARTEPAINWGNTTTLPATLQHIRGGEYIGDRFLRPAPGARFTPQTYRSFVAGQTGQYLADFATQWGSPTRNENQYWDPITSRRFAYPAGVTGWLLAFATVGLAIHGFFICWQAVQLRVLLSAIVVSAGGSQLTGYLYNISDIRDYNLLPVWASSWLAIYGGTVLIQRQVLHARKVPPFPKSAAWLWLVVPVLVGLGNYPEQRSARATSDDAEFLGALILPESLDVMPKDSILITTGDDEIFLSWYRQHVRGLRRDVLIFGGNFISVPWYRGFFKDEQLKQYGIQFADRVALGPDTFAEQVDRGIIRTNVHKRPIFTSSGDGLFLAELNKRYALNPVISAPVLIRGSDLEVTVTLHRIMVRDSPATGPGVP